MLQRLTVVSVTMTAMAVVLRAVAMITATTITTIVAAAFVAHVVTQCGTAAATYRRADQAAGAAADAATQHITARCAQTAANGCFCAVATICAYSTTGCAADTRANC